MYSTSIMTHVSHSTSTAIVANHSLPDPGGRYQGLLGRVRTSQRPERRKSFAVSSKSKTTVNNRRWIVVLTFYWPHMSTSTVSALYHNEYHGVDVNNNNNNNPHIVPTIQEISPCILLEYRVQSTCWERHEESMARLHPIPRCSFCSRANMI